MFINNNANKRIKAIHNSNTFDKHKYIESDVKMYSFLWKIALNVWQRAFDYMNLLSGQIFPFVRAEYLLMSLMECFKTLSNRLMQCVFILLRISIDTCAPPKRAEKKRLGIKTAKIFSSVLFLSDFES